MDEEFVLKVQLSCQNLCKVLDTEEDFKKKITILEQLLINFHSIKQKELYLIHVPHYEECISSIIKSISVPGLVQDFAELEERDFDERDFPYVADAAVKSFSCLKLLLPKLNIQFKDLVAFKDLLIPILKLCATHHDHFLWSNDSTVLLSKETLEILLTISNCPDVTTLLCGGTENHPRGLFKSILLLMRPSLTKHTWTRNPSTCHIFKWLLLNVKHQHLGNFLEDVLPPSLVFVDHHIVTSKVLGITCLDHIIDNVPPAELKMHDRADVVYDVLHRLIYYNEPPVTDVLYPCLLKFLRGQERDPNNACILRNWGRYDDVYQRLLLNLEVEDRVILRRAYSAHFSKFIERMGITICRHLKHTVEVILKYLEVHDGPEEISRINTLLALHSLIRVAWIRMPYHMLPLLKGLMCLVYDIETDCGTNVESVKKEIFNLCKECMMLLKITSPQKFEAVTQGMVELQGIPAVDLLKSVIDTPC